MKSEKSITYIVVAVVAAVIALLAISFIPRDTPGTSYGDINGGVNNLPSINNNTGVTVGAQVSTRVVATSTGRLWMRLSNPSANTVYCNLSDASSSVATGMSIAAGGSFTIDANDLYTGSIQCEDPTASTTLLVTGQQ